MDKPFDKIPLSINDMFKMYLQLIGIEQKFHMLSNVQQIETKRAFFGAAGILLVALTDEMTKLEDDQYARTLMEFKNEIHAFWSKEQVGGLNFKFKPSQN